ncbi:MAG: GIY-YIG nuclease family protein [Bacteroidetes bacterium]|nr:GIY-YIG nuclease family protein [Bacteroidota bacterium]
MEKTYNFWVYILTNYQKKTLYVGRTNDLVTRLKEHYINRGNPKTFAGRYFCYYLVYQEWDKYVWNSINREKEIKSWTREKKEALITDFNPEWKFLNIELCGKWPPDVEPRFNKER